MEKESMQATEIPKSKARAQHVAFLGRAGDGTSTVVSNVSALLAKAGVRVVQVGWSDDCNSTEILRYHRTVVPLTRSCRNIRKNLPVPVCAFGCNEVVCLEAGFKNLCDLHCIRELSERLAEGWLEEELAAEFVLYDLKAVQVGPISALLEHGPVSKIFPVLRAQAGSLRQINRILQQLASVGHRIGLGGLVGNGLPDSCSEMLVESFARSLGSRVVAYLPWSPALLRCEFFGQTFVEGQNHTSLAGLFRQLAEAVGSERGNGPIRGMEDELFQDWLLEWGERLYQADQGLVRWGDAI
jgi:nitrogenase iron protein NifH